MKKHHVFFMLIFIISVAIPNTVYADFFSLSLDKGEETNSTGFALPDGVRYTIPDEYDSYIFSNAINQEPIIDGKGFAGNFSMSGKITDVGEKNGFKSYLVGEGDVLFTITVNTDYLPQQLKDGWEISVDLAQKVNHLNFSDRDDVGVHEGAIIIQVSGNSKNWISYKFHNGIFYDLRKEGKTDHQFSTNKIQLNNGCYYRIIFVYELKKEKSEKSFLGSKYDFVNYAEVYQVHLYNEESLEDESNDQQYRIGTKVKTGENFFGSETLDIKDKHYGWDLGSFFVTGYTEHQEIDGNHIFLKNVGDKIKLWFNLQQDISALNGNSKLKIKNDKNITDQFFELPKTNFEHGALIIRYTDYQNIPHEPVVYTNFLEAYSFPFANTKVELFEEGDYEVALDYSIDKNHYRIAFNYSIRNSNCMVYPFDIVTKSEMVNSSYTENGFYLDLARSRYLDINVKRAVMVNDVEDIRFNRSARDGEQYTDEGIYIITVKNKVTGEQTEKRIYVGADYKSYSQK